MEETKTKIAPPGLTKSSYEKLLRKMYISNVAKRLRQLNQPSDVDRKRWVWELIQNAKDTIVGDPSRNQINVRIDIDGDTVVFRHDGNPFTSDARFGLLYKYSEDKENSESTGRFGTGFLTTHCLSKVVTIESNMYSNEEQTAICGFSVTMYRDGQREKELLEGLDKMEESEEWYEEPFKWTSFIYHVSTDSGRRAIKLGVENFHKNIAQTMLFCKELASIELNDNGKITSITRRPVLEVYPNVMSAEFEIHAENTTIRRFLYSSYKEYNKELSDKYRAVRDVRINAAIEVDAENCIVNHSGETSHYCVLPLVGIESQLDEPLILNSPDFEPDEERQSLLMSGQNWDDEHNNISEVGINQTIYSKIYSLYENLVSYLSENHFGKLYLLANGLKKPKEHKKLDSKWYSENVLKGFRDVLLKYSVVEPFYGTDYKKLSECIIVKEPKTENETFVFDLLTHLYPSRLVKSNHEWAQHVWKDGLETWGTEELCNNIEEKANWNSISVKDTSLAEWYNKFLSYVYSYDERLLKEHALLPNMNGVLNKKDTDNFRQGEKVTPFIIDLLLKLGKDVKPMLLHGDITAISLDSKYNSQSYSSDVNKLAKALIDEPSPLAKLQKVLPLLSVIPTDGEKYKIEFIEQRKAFFNIAKSLFSLKDAVITEDDNLLDGAWKELDIWFVSHVLNKLKSIGCLSGLPEGLDSTWLNNTLKSLKVEISRLNTFAVLPNQNGSFCLQNKLYEDKGIPESLKNSVFNGISLNYKEILLDKNIDAATFAINQKKEIATFASDLRGCFASQSSYYSSFPYSINGRYYKYQQSTLDNVALYILSLIPTNLETEVGINQENIYTTSRNILGSDVVPDSESIDYSSKDLWQDSNFFVVSMISNKIKTAAKIDVLNEQLGSKGEVYIFDQLNSFYSFLIRSNISYSAPRIFPNQEGEFCAISELKKEEGTIDDTIKNIICLLVDAKDDYRHILMDKRCTLQPQALLNSDNAYALIDEKVAEYYKSTDKWKEENFIKAAQLLIEDWGDKHRGTFEEKFPRVFDDKEKILMNVVWKKEKRELMLNFSTLPNELLNYVIENSAEIGELSNKVQELENSNKDLQSKNEELQRQIDALTTSPVSEPTPTGKPAEPTEPPTPPAIINFKTQDGEVKGYNVQESQYGGLSQEQIVSFVQQAKTDVAVYLDELGYVIDWDYVEMPTYSQLYGVKDANGERIPVVVHSYRCTGRDFDLNWYDWEFLNSSEKSMLWVVPSTGGPQCVPLCSLPMKKVTIPIEGQSLAEQSKLIALATVAETYSYVRFDFGTQIPINQKTPVPFRFLPEEMKLGVESIAQICNNEIPLIHKELPYMGYNSALSYKRPIKSIAVSNEESCSIEDLNASRVEISGQITSDNSEELI